MGSTQTHAGHPFRPVTGQFLLSGGLAVFALLAASCRTVDEATTRLTGPQRYELGEDAARLVENPAEAGMRIRRIPFVTEDGVRTVVLMVDGVPASGASATRAGELLAHGYQARGASRRPRGTVLMMHGINSRKEHMLWTAEWLTTCGYRCVVWDSRGHGESDPAKAGFGALETRDTEDIYQMLRRRGVISGPVHIFGHSMGAAVALQWLPHHPEFRSAVLTAPFARLSDVMSYQASRRAGGTLRLFLPLVRNNVRKTAHFDPYAINPVDHASSIRLPILYIHGRNDTVVPPSQTEQLVKQSRNPESVRLLTSGGHNDALSSGGFPALIAVLRFLDGNS